MENIDIEKTVISLIHEHQAAAYTPIAIALTESLLLQFKVNFSASSKYFSGIRLAAETDSFEFFGVPIFTPDEYQIAQRLLAKVSIIPVSFRSFELGSELIRVYAMPTYQIGRANLSVELFN